MNDDTKTQVKFVASQEDVERWRADAKEAGLSFSEHVRRRLDLSVGPVAVPDPDPPEQPSVQAGEDWTTCEAPDCEIPVQGGASASLIARWRTLPSSLEMEVGEKRDPYERRPLREGPGLTIVAPEDDGSIERMPGGATRLIPGKSTRSLREYRRRP